MKIQSNPNPQAPSNLPKPNAPKQPDAPPPNDGNDINWASVRQAACRGGAIGLAGAAGSVLPGGLGVVASGGLGAYTAYKVMNNPEAAIGGALIGIMANAATAHWGLAGVPLGVGFGALAATAAEMRRQSRID